MEYTAGKPYVDKVRTSQRGKDTENTDMFNTRFVLLNNGIMVAP